MISWKFLVILAISWHVWRLFFFYVCTFLPPKYQVRCSKDQYLLWDFLTGSHRNVLGVNSLAGVSIHEPIFLVASLIPMLTHDCREGKNHLRVSGRFSRTWQKPPGLFSAWVCLALKTYNKIVKHFRQSSFICYVLKSDWSETMIEKYAKVRTNSNQLLFWVAL